MKYDEFQKMFAEFGDILSSKLEINPDGNCKGHGYVQFSKSESANAAIQKYNGKKYGEKDLQVAIVQKRTEEQFDNFTNLFVNGLPIEWTEKELTTLFKECGEIQSVSKKGEGSSSGFVQFKKHEDAVKAIEAFNAKKEING